jgi:adsorption protein B
LFEWDIWHWLAAFQHELLLFAGVFFLIGAADDLAIDGIWLWLKARGRAVTRQVEREPLRARALSGPTAIIIPAWQEASVIGGTVRHMLAAWPQPHLRLYIGCYRNDPETIAAVVSAAAHCRRAGHGGERVRIVIHDASGPTTKADCLNRLCQALRDDERRVGALYASVVFHDAEDFVDPAALGLLDETIAQGADFVQLPVEPLAQPGRSWIGSHYCEEFAEAHGKAMVVREALGAGLPAAGVGCALSRRALNQLARRRIDGKPFDGLSLTEDYELGLAVADMGGTCRFVRVRGEDGTLIATRAYFPSRLQDAVRQKTRWIHGIALQGWDRVGWSGGALEKWMRARDRRGPLTALVLAIGYALLAVTGLLWLAVALGLAPEVPLSPLLAWLLTANLVAFAWRAVWRFGFTASIYGWAEGLRAVLRIPLANVIAIIAGRRAVIAYARTLLGRTVIWDKTPHDMHPAVPLHRGLAEPGGA